MHKVRRCGLLLPMFRGLCVCVCVVHIGKPCPAKTVEPIEMPFGLVGPRNHMLVVGPDPPTGTVTLGGMYRIPFGQLKRVQSLRLPDSTMSDTHQNRHATAMPVDATRYHYCSNLRVQQDSGLTG